MFFICEQFFFRGNSPSPSPSVSKWVPLPSLEADFNLHIKKIIRIRKTIDVAVWIVAPIVFYIGFLWIIKKYPTFKP